MSNTDEYYETVIQLVNEAGMLIKNNINRQKNVLTKSCDVDLVTETDRQVERLLMDGISAKFPDHKFIGEETMAETNQKIELTVDPTWIIDPVDGTMNFVHKFPHVCISIALLIEKTTEIGIIYNPILDQMFTARKGRGAFLNGKTINVSQETELQSALIMMEMGTSRDPEKTKVLVENITTLTPLIHGTRALGSAALNMCMVAMGGADINYEFGIHAWDIAAGDLIVREAGGVCIDPAGGTFDIMSRRVLCASTMSLAQKIAKILIQYYPERD
ncbi:inositol monophosphatase 1-like [Leptopilina heterotoma]|uniref:inositol monophosphatase 1-like n=1 Tax=Leptopilina heterotoma TaxID=63436 RepID=UPI001CA8814E|nr:inositol monophosphatase 1-like [Leptopilina heterotoma]